MRPSAQDLQFLQPDINESDIESLKSGPKRTFSQNLEEVTFLAVGPVYVELDDVAEVVSLCMFYLDSSENGKPSENYSLRYSMYPEGMPGVIFLNKNTKFMVSTNKLIIKTATNTYKFMPITDKLWTKATGIQEPWKTSFEIFMNGPTSEED